jgi:hypothetical protein
LSKEIAMMTRMQCPLILSLALLGCGGDEAGPGPQPPAPQPPAVVTSTQSACKGAPAGSFAANGLTARASGGSVTIEHADAVYNCAAKVKLTATVTGTDIVVQETITNPNEVADCVCTYDLSLEIKGLAAGTYTVKVIDDGGKLVGTTQATVPSMSLQVIDSLQSACKANAYLAAGQLGAKMQGGSLMVTHEDAVYNCASKVKMTATLVGTIITVREVITNPGQLANCMCTYDLSVELKGLAAGSYTVRVLDADGQLAGVLQVTIP